MLRIWNNLLKWQIFWINTNDQIILIIQKSERNGKTSQVITLKKSNKLDSLTAFTF